MCWPTTRVDRNRAGRVGLCALAVLGAIFVGACSADDTPPAANSPTSSPSFTAPTTAAPEPQLPAAEAQSIELAVTADQPQAVAAVLAPEVRTAYLAKPQALLPEGATVELDSAAATRTENTMTVPATVTAKDGTTAPWTFYLVDVDETWLVYAVTEGTP
jgi:hypothetical protein